MKTVNICNISVKNLERALVLRSKIQALQEEVQSLLAPAEDASDIVYVGGMSKKGREAVSAGQKRRWEKWHAEHPKSAVAA